MQCSYDELLNKTEEYMKSGDWGNGLIHAREAVSRNRICLKANYMEAVCAENRNEWLESYRYYSILFNLQHIAKKELVPEEELLGKINEIMDEAVRHLNELEFGQRIKYKDDLLDVNAEDKDICQNYFMRHENVENYWGIHTYFGKEYYIGRYGSWFPHYTESGNVENGVLLKSEIYEVIGQGRFTVIDDKSTDFPCVLPIVTNTDGKLNTIKVKGLNSGKDCSFLDGYSKAYSYLRLEEAGEIRAEEPAVFGKPVPLHHREGNKKLVLGIFIDSLNYKFIRDEDLKTYMPNTFDFFKKGVICNEYYSGSEFTYPSIASYWTGRRSTVHQMLNVDAHYPIPSDMPLLSELFHDNGYFTAKIGGNYSVAPQYGYIRGIDRFLYGYSEAVFHVDDVVSETIEHVKSFSETDQFVWIDIQDLHYVAGYWPMPISVQAHLPVNVREVDNEGGSSLYQTPSPHRRMVYGEQLKHVDSQLKYIYDYVLENYSEDEFVISLISDHGNGFNVDEGNYFICEQRMNVPLMVRGGEASRSIYCDEKMETVDYAHILTRLAGISDKRLEGMDGQLPVFFGGEKEKEYVFSQSLFPNRNYCAMILGKDYKFYIQSAGLVDHECRVSLENAYADLRNAEGESIEDEKLLADCMDIVTKWLGDFRKEKGA